MTEQDTQHLSDYLAILRRRKKQVLVPMVLILLASVALAFVLPPVYRSSATILIEEELVPQELVTSTAAGYANERIELITKRLMTHNNLQQIAESVSADPEQDALMVQNLRKNIKIKTVSAQVTDPRSGTSTTATIAFTVSFDAPSSAVAHKVTTELVGLYLNANLMLRTRKAEVTSAFLAEEERKLGASIAELEAKLAVHKERNVGRLPELMNMNMQLMERTERGLEDTERQIYTLEQRKMFLESQLANLEPYTGQGPAGRLKELQTEYLKASSVYAPSHPDVVHLRKEIELLKRELGVIDERDAVGEQLKKARAQLEIARKSYANNHPDVIILERSVRKLEQALKDAETSTQLGITLKPDNPAYISVMTQLDATRLDLKAAKEQRSRAREKLVEYERRVTESPRVEQEGLVLQRAYDNAVKEHQEIKDKLMRAELSVELEKKQRAQRYSLLEPPALPKAPVEPNRPAILLLGIVLSLGGGIGYASLAEYMDRSFHGSKHVHALLGAPPLAVIPHIEAKKARHQQRRIA